MAGGMALSKRPRDGDNHGDLPRIKLAAACSIYLQCPNVDIWNLARTKVDELLPCTFTTFPPEDVAEGVRVVEFKLRRPLELLVVSRVHHSEWTITLSVDGLADPSGSAVTIFVAEVLVLVDTDKQPGLSQLFITDLFTRMSVAQNGTTAQ